MSSEVELRGHVPLDRNLQREVRVDHADRTRVVTISNPEGGVGKTVLANEIAVSLTRDYRKTVLLVDLNPSGNLTGPFAF